jgi:hypothetical protein
MEMQKFYEPLSRTLLRTVGLALLAGAILAWRTGGMQRLPAAFLVVLWFTLGGHFIELFYLNWLRGRLPQSVAVRVVARLIVWFLGGVLLGAGSAFTATQLGGFVPSQIPPLWLAGMGFVAIELVVHLPMQLRGGPSFYNGRA